jgi:3-oxoacyl-[acyl-carrier-protein] synthase III
MNQKIENVFIESVAACVPKNKISASFFDDLLDPKELKRFEKTTGIIERRYADNNITASDLGYVAAKKILDERKCSSEIKALIFLSQTSDYIVPFTSNILQQRLGLSKEILCLDINAGCSGFVQGLSIAYSLANTLTGKVLLIVSETLSKILSKKDRSTSMLFGDAGSAILITKGGSTKKDSYFNFFSDGSNADAIMISDGGYRNPFNKDSLNIKKDSRGNLNNCVQLRMDGPRVFDFTLREIPSSINELLKVNSLSKDSVGLFLFHQSNRFIIKQIASQLKIPIEKIPFNIDKFGNTSGVSIPLLMVTELDQNKNYNNLLMSGYGAGLNWGNCLVHLSDTFEKYDLIEL